MKAHQDSSHINNKPIAHVAHILPHTRTSQPPGHLSCRIKMPFQNLVSRIPIGISEKQKGSSFFVLAQTCKTPMPMLQPPLSTTRNLKPDTCSVHHQHRVVNSKPGVFFPPSAVHPAPQERSSFPCGGAHTIFIKIRSGGGRRGTGR